MRHEYFGLLGGLFSDRELARIAIISAEVPAELRAFLRGDGPLQALSEALSQVAVRHARVEAARETLLQIHLSRLRGVLSDRRVDPRAVAMLRKELPALWASFTGRGFVPYAISIHSVGAEIDRQWLATTLTTESHVGSVFFKATRTDFVPWKWPLRIGVPSTREGTSLYADLEGGRYDYLYRSILIHETSDPVDLLLLPGSLATAYDQFKKGAVRAGAVVVLGGAEVSHLHASRRLHSLLDRYSAGLSGIVFVPRAERAAWVQTLVRELSHNYSLPGAAFAARQSKQRKEEGGENTEDLAVPLMIGDSVFVAGTCIANAARSLAEALKGASVSDVSVTVNSRAFLNVPAGPLTLTGEKLGALIEENLTSFKWLSERGDATDLVGLTTEIEAQVGPLVSARESVDLVVVENRGPAFAGEPSYSIGEIDFPRGYDLPVTSPGPEPPQAERHVQAEITPLAAHLGANRPVPVKHLTSGGDFRLRVHIGELGRPDVVVAATPLEESRLPPSRVGHDLQIIYCPLTAVPNEEGGAAIPPPAQVTVHLPRWGDSTYADFLLRCGEEPAKFRSRLIVAHENRVLQTLMIRTLGADAEVDIAEENVYSSRLSSDYPTRSPDIAFVANDNPQGASGIATLAGGEASFVEPPGLKAYIEAVRGLLSGSNIKAVGTRQPKLSSKRIVDLLIELANHGAAIVFELKRQHPVAVFESATRIQVVEAVDSAYLPVEFFYSGIAPRPGAKLCPNAESALNADSHETHRTCPHAKDDHYVCPAAFWGMHKCIERLASSNGREHRFAEPELGTDRLGPFQAALVAASDRAKEQMVGPKSVPATVAKVMAKVDQATSWDDWQQKVATLEPQLLLLLPHSAKSPHMTTMSALEVSDDWLESSRVQVEYLRAQDSQPPGPLVLLLGCSTVLADIEYLNFVQKFHQLGAPVVVGTLATVHATQAALVACALVNEIKASNGNNEARFDAVLLKVKRDLLASGRDVALGLIAYGHSSWRV